jgi:hypothetical protein
LLGHKRADADEPEPGVDGLRTGIFIVHMEERDGALPAVQMQQVRHDAAGVLLAEVLRVGADAADLRKALEREALAAMETSSPSTRIPK